MAELAVNFYPKQAENSLLGTISQATDIQQRHQDLVKGQVQYLADGLGALASKADLSQNDMLGFAQNALKEGIISPQTFQVETAAVAKAGNDPNALRALATNYSLRALDAGQRFSAQFPTPQLMNTGQAQIPVTAGPLSGIKQIGAPVQNQLSPAELAAPTTVGVNAQNQPVTGTLGQFLHEVGANPLTGQPATPTAQPANALLPSQNSPDASVAPVPLAPLPQGPKGIVTAPAPGAAEAQTEVGKGSGAQYQSDLAQAAGYQQATLPLVKALPALEALGTSGTGPGTEQINQMKSFLLSMGVGEAAGIDPNNVKAFDEAKKYLTQYVNMTGNSGTNDKLAASFAGNPSTEISNAAAVDVAKTALSLSRLQNAQVRAFGDTGLPPDQYSKYAKDFNATQDPRAYGLDLMAPAQRVTLIKSLKGDASKPDSEKGKFVQSLKTAMSLGLVTPPVSGP